MYSTDMFDHIATMLAAPAPLPECGGKPLGLRVQSSTAAVKPAAADSHR